MIVKKNSRECKQLLTKLIIVISLLLPYLSFGQIKLNKNLKFLVPLQFGVGILDNFNETIKDDYQAFLKVFPKTNQNWSNPEISHVNKWEGGDRRNGERFFLSSTILVWTTDLRHLLQTSIRVGDASTGLVYYFGGKRGGWKDKKWYWYFADFGIMFVSRSAGWHFSDKIIFNKRFNF